MSTQHLPDLLKQRIRYALKTAKMIRILELLVRQISREIRIHFILDVIAKTAQKEGGDKRKKSHRAQIDNIRMRHYPGTSWH